MEAQENNKGLNLGKSKDFPFFMHEKRRVTVFVVEWYEKGGEVGWKPESYWKY